MIHDQPVIRVTCDGPWCDPEQVFIPFPVKHPLLPPQDVEWVLATKHEWIVRAGQHFCCQACAETRVDEPFNPVHMPPRARLRKES